ncbi:MAG: dienelactone hydrolase family protein [Acidobacteria bacterium]|nr:dienelactone hydrolase family protein [Acidobacteriota bacterium]
MRSFPFIPRSAVLLLAVALVAAGSAIAQELPGSADTARDRLNTSPRHGEWVSVPAPGGDVVESWIVYPERSDPAPVVVVIHEIFGLTDWIRAVADEMASQGFVAIAPDLLTGKGPDGGRTDSVDNDGARALIRELDRDEVHTRLKAVADWATSLPAARDSYGVVGCCWGGRTSFTFATHDPELGAAIVYYGTSPDNEALASGEAPVLGLSGEDAARGNATLPPAQQRMEELGKHFQVEIFDGAGHGFLRAQDGREGRNLTASSQAWPMTVRFFREHLGS